MSDKTQNCNRHKDAMFLLNPAPEIKTGIPSLTEREAEAFVLGGEYLVKYLEQSNKASLKENEHRLQTLVSVFDSTYRPPSFRAAMKSPKGVLKNPRGFRRVFACATLSMILKDSVDLFSLGMDGPAIIDAYAVVERFATQFVVKTFDAKQSRSKVVARMVERTTLDDLAKFLRDRRILDNADVAVVERLTRLRNGIVHKNQLSVSKLLFSGKPISPFDIPKLAKRIDTQSVMLASLGLILKIFEASVRLAPPRLRRQFAIMTGQKRQKRTVGMSSSRQK